MRIGALSQELATPTPTVRRWCLEFAAGLSPAGRGGDGRPREFSARDFRLLRRVRELMLVPEMTFERARRELRTEGLLMAGESGAASASPTASDERAVRRAAEKALHPYVNRLDGIDTRLRELEEKLAVVQQRLAEQDRLIADLGQPDLSRRRRSWPFR